VLEKPVHGAFSVAVTSSQKSLLAAKDGEAHALKAGKRFGIELGGIVRDVELALARLAATAEEGVEFEGVGNAEGDVWCESKNGHQHSPSLVGIQLISWNFLMWRTSTSGNVLNLVLLAVS
jgi:hypothetical protein